MLPSHLLEELFGNFSWDPLVDIYSSPFKWLNWVAQVPNDSQSEQPKRKDSFEYESQMCTQTHLVRAAY